MKHMYEVKLTRTKTGHGLTLDVAARDSTEALDRATAIANRNMSGRDYATGNAYEPWRIRHSRNTVQ